MLRQCMLRAMGTQGESSRLILGTGRLSRGRGDIPGGGHCLCKSLVVTAVTQDCGVSIAVGMGEMP